ncbi:MAG TPA: hypothetical protein PLE70_07720 [Methanolinea sp.]|nr:hypothetical protein [Methanolinea sp.]
MELTVHDESNSTLDTTKDTCLFRAERRPGQAAYTRGKDLYLHSRRGLSPLYYIHRWSLNPGEKERISLISPVMASRFLEERGILCDGLTDIRGAAILRSWGYGILEEF